MLLELFLASCTHYVAVAVKYNRTPAVRTPHRHDTVIGVYPRENCIAALAFIVRTKNTRIHARVRAEVAVAQERSS